MTLVECALLATAAAVAGAINSVAGGGTLISFPAAIAMGLSPLAANATNAVALTPGSIASAYAYRRELGRDLPVVRRLLPAAAIGGVLGSVLLLLTPQSFFDAIVPALVLFATLLLFFQNVRRAPTAKAGSEWNLPEGSAAPVVLQFLVGVYGGYFGAGMGIMMLALLSRFGGADIHRMNGVKSVLGAVINAVAALAFIVAGAIDYRAAALMAVGAVLGGLLGAAGARRVKPAIVRWGVVAMGFVLTASLAHHRWFAHG